jgi:hypothetical protein
MSKPPPIRLNWRGAGYHAFPLSRRDPDLPDASGWAEFERILEKAKRGDFSAIPEIVNLYDKAESWLLSGASIALLGDAGTPKAFERVLPVVQALMDPTYEVYLSKALAFWGKLAVVPPIVTGWQALEGFQDAEDIPPVLSMMLEEAPGAIADAPDHSHKVEYGTLVLAQYEKLKRKFGTDDVIVFRGDRFGVRRLAALVLADLAAGRFEPYMRRRFEAATGLDCSAFYREEALQALAISAIVEEFLESPDVAKYEDGVRYFFGHRIPE